MHRFGIVFVSLAALAASANAQVFQRRAALVSGGSADYGRCTAEVVVDGAAEVEIRGDMGILRNVWGQPPQWRRFECTGLVPADPVNFRFRGIDGRGHQQLIRDPRNGGAAVVRIEDPEGGADVYAFELSWNGLGGRLETRDRMQGERLTMDQAVTACENAVVQQTSDRFRTRRVSFRNVRMDENPGRSEWLVGLADVTRDGWEDRLRFSCSVSFDTGRVRSVQLDPMSGSRDREVSGSVALDRCQREVTERLREDGYGRVDFGSIRMDDRPGRNDWVIGNARADGRSFDFSCSVDLRDGDVRSVDVRRR